MGHIHTFKMQLWLFKVTNTCKYCNVGESLIWWNNEWVALDCWCAWSQNLKKETKASQYNKIEPRVTTTTITSVCRAQWINSKVFQRKSLTITHINIHVNWSSLWWERGRMKLLLLRHSLHKDSIFILSKHIQNRLLTFFAKIRSYHIMGACKCQTPWYQWYQSINVLFDLINHNLLSDLVSRGIYLQT